MLNSLLTAIAIAVVIFGAVLAATYVLLGGRMGWKQLNQLLKGNSR